jgi:hypothetical protein
MVEEHRNRPQRLDLARLHRSRGRAQLTCRRQYLPRSAEQQKVHISRLGERGAQPSAVRAERPRRPGAFGNAAHGLLGA